MLSLFDRSGNMARPWAKAGHTCLCFDIQHDETTVEQVGRGEIRYVGGDILDWLPPRTEYAFVSVFAPCYDIAVSGARWFPEKGMDGLGTALQLFERGRHIAEWSGAPWMIENPVSVVSSYWRDPDYTFHPGDYDRNTNHDEAYSKRTCLWTSDDFRLPEDAPAEAYDDRIHKMGPSEDRSDARSETPMGFAKSVHSANCDACDSVNVRDSIPKGHPDSEHLRHATDLDAEIISDILGAQSRVVVAVFDAIREERGPWQLNDFSTRVEAHDDTVRRTLRGLVAADVLTRPSERKYARGPRATQLVGIAPPKGGVSDAHE